MKKKILTLALVALATINVVSKDAFAAYVIVTSKTEYYAGARLYDTKYTTGSMTCAPGKSPREVDVKVKIVQTDAVNSKQTYTYTYKCM